MAKSYRQGFYRPKNPTKYQGDPTNIVYRSSWERIVFSYLDNSTSCVGWAAEEIVIPYISPVDGKGHRYFPDIKTSIRQPDGTVKTFLVEIKPYDQTMPPKNTRNKKTLMENLATWEINQAKWHAAKKYCAERGYEFMIMTEYEIGLKKRT